MDADMNDASICTHWTIDRDILRLLIARRGYTPTSLALEVGVNRRVLHRLLSGERTSATYPTADAIAGALNIDITLFADPSLQWVTQLKSG